MVVIIEPEYGILGVVFEEFSNVVDRETITLQFSSEFYKCVTEGCFISSCLCSAPVLLLLGLLISI